MAAITVQNILTGTADDINDDLNGECFIAGAEGEAEVWVENNMVIFPLGMGAAGDNTANTPVAYNSEAMIAFLVLNVHHSLALGRTEEVSAKVAFIRFLCARTGLVSPSFTNTLHNVRYNHAIWSDVNIAGVLEGLGETYARAGRVVQEKLTAQVRKDIKLKFTNIVCCVAYMFRVRGHHYMRDFQDRYTTLWARCLYKPEDLVLDWEYAATDALHAVMPDILDNFWVQSAENSRCAGTLIKRLDSAPAGAAGVNALERGLNDVRMLFPGIVRMVPESYAEFERVTSDVKGSRWGGSINARFYGVSRKRIDEAKIGALAAAVLGTYDSLAPNSKLRESQALQRLAQIAPATGGAIGLAAARAAKDERLNLIAYSVPAEATGVE